MGLFKNEPFLSHAGNPLLWKIECDALDDEDIETLASIIARHFKFSEVIGIPRGGIRLANALLKYRSGASGILIVDDVFTTGKSMEEARRNHGKDDKDIIGIVIFARGEVSCPPWIKPICLFSDWTRP